MKNYGFGTTVDDGYEALSVTLGYGSVLIGISITKDEDDNLFYGLAFTEINQPHDIGALSQEDNKKYNEDESIHPDFYMMFDNKDSVDVVIEQLSKVKLKLEKSE